MTLAGLILLDLALIAVLDVVVVRPIGRLLRRSFAARRLGQLAPPVAVELSAADMRLIVKRMAAAAEAVRHERLCKLGETGTYRVYNCGKILAVDYERGELIVERDGSYRG